MCSDGWARGSAFGQDVPPGGNQLNELAKSLVDGVGVREISLHLGIEDDG